MRNALVLILLGFVSNSAQAKLDEVDDAVRKSQQTYIEHFSEFTRDKNVQGKAKLPNGKVVETGRKTRQNSDDKLNFISDLTYHDYSFSTKDEEHAKKNPGKSRTLPAFVSDHGAQADSSLLERTVYEAHDKLSKEQEDPKQEKKADEEKGVQYKSIFKITKKEVEKDPNKKTETGAEGKGNQDEVQKVERKEVVGNVRTELENVGNIAFESLERAAKDKESQDDPDSLANSTLLAEGAYRGEVSWWKSTLANLGQERINRGAKEAGGGPGGGFRPQLSEGLVSCDRWGQEAMKQTQQQQQGGGGGKSDQQAIQKAVEKCKELARTKYDVIDPKYEKEGKGEKIISAGVEKERGDQRDLRNQMEVLGNVMIEAGDLKSNWKYTDEDLQSEIAIGYKDGEVIRNKLKMSDQINSYNEQLDQAADDVKSVNSKLPKNYQIKPEQIQSYKIEGGTAAEITKRAAQKEYEDYIPPEPVNLPDSYEALIQEGE